SNRSMRRSAPQKSTGRPKDPDRERAKMHQSLVQKGAQSKARLPVVETSVEISKSKLRPHSRTPKTFRTEIRPRDYRRPTNTDSESANDLRTSCAPCRRTLAAPTIRNRHSKKRADCARA